MHCPLAGCDITTGDETGSSPHEAREEETEEIPGDIVFASGEAECRKQSSGELEQEERRRPGTPSTAHGGRREAAVEEPAGRGPGLPREGGEERMRKGNDVRKAYVLAGSTRMRRGAFRRKQEEKRRACAEAHQDTKQRPRADAQ